MSSWKNETGKMVRLLILVLFVSIIFITLASGRIIVSSKSTIPENNRQTIHDAVTVTTKPAKLYPTKTAANDTQPPPTNIIKPGITLRIDDRRGNTNMTKSDGGTAERSPPGQKPSQIGQLPQVPQPISQPPTSSLDDSNKDQRGRSATGGGQQPNRTTQSTTTTGKNEPTVVNVPAMPKRKNGTNGSNVSEVTTHASDSTHKRKSVNRPSIRLQAPIPRTLLKLKDVTLSRSSRNANDREDNGTYRQIVEQIGNIVNAVQQYPPRHTHHMLQFYLWENMNDERMKILTSLLPMADDTSNNWFTVGLNANLQCKNVEIMVNDLMENVFRMYSRFIAKSSYNDMFVFLADLLLRFYQLYSVLIVHDECCHFLVEWSKNHEARELLRLSFAYTWLMLALVLRQYHFSFPSIVNAVLLLNRCDENMLQYLRVNIISSIPARYTRTNLYIGSELIRQTVRHDYPKVYHGDMRQSPAEHMTHLHVEKLMMQQAIGNKDPRSTYTTHCWYSVWAYNFREKFHLLMPEIPEHVIIQMNNVVHPLPHMHVCGRYTEHRWTNLGNIYLYETMEHQELTDRELYRELFDNDNDDSVAASNDNRTNGNIAHNGRNGYGLKTDRGSSNNGSNHSQNGGRKSGGKPKIASELATKRVYVNQAAMLNVRGTIGRINCVLSFQTFVKTFKFANVRTEVTSFLGTQGNYRQLPPLFGIRVDVCTRSTMTEFHAQVKPQVIGLYNVFQLRNISSENIARIKAVSGFNDSSSASYQQHDISIENDDQYGILDLPLSGRKVNTYKIESAAASDLIFVRIERWRKESDRNRTSLRVSNTGNVQLLVRQNVVPDTEDNRLSIVVLHNDNERADHTEALGRLRLNLKILHEYNLPRYSYTNYESSMKQNQKLLISDST